MKATLWVILLLFSILSCTAQDDLASFYFSQIGRNIPASQTYITHSEFSCKLQNDFFTKELMRKSLSLGFNYDENNFSIDIEHYGYHSYGNLSLGVGYGRLFGKRLSVMLRTIYLMQHAEHYTCRHSFTIDISCCYQISHKIGFGIQLFNPIRMRYGVIGRDVIPMHYSLQAHFQSSKKILFYANLSQYLPGEIDFGIGLCYHPIPLIIFDGECRLRKCGIGVFVLHKNIQFGFRTEWYYQNSFSLEASVHYQFDLKQTIHESPIHKHIPPRNLSTTSSSRCRPVR